MGSKRRVRKPSRVQLGAMPGRWQKQHGGYSLLRSLGYGTLDGRRREWTLLKALMHELAADQGAPWENLSAARRLLTEAAATKAVVLAMMGSWAIERGAVAADGTLATTLRENFLGYANSLRHDLVVLGLERRAKDAVDLDTHLERTYGSKDGAGA